MALPDIRFNNGTGSDTQASGAGPSTALYGSDASTDSGGTTVTVPNKDLTNVATDGSHVVWVNMSSGRQFGKITGKGNSGLSNAYVTIADAMTGSQSSKTYAIGGKRQTINETNSRKLFSADLKAGWTVTLEDDQPALSSALSLGVAGTIQQYITFRGDSTSSRRLITVSTNINLLTATSGNGYGYWSFENLKFESTSSTRTSNYLLKDGTDAQGTVFKNCIFGHATNKLYTTLKRGGSGGQWGVTFIDCEIQYCTGPGLDEHTGGGGSCAQFYNCYIHDCTGAGIASSYGGGAHWIFYNCIITKNGGDGITLPPSYTESVSIINCVIAENTGDGIETPTYDGSQQNMFVIINNQIIHNGGYGIRFGKAPDKNVVICDYNNFGSGSGTWSGANTSGQYYNYTAGANDMSVDPQFTNAASGDFSIGTNCKAKGWPSSADHVGKQTTTHTFVDIGAAQREEPAGGGGGLLTHPGMGGGMRG